MSEFGYMLFGEQKQNFPILLAQLKTRFTITSTTMPKKKDIYLTDINGHKEHVHCLISLSANQSIAKVIQLLKGESSFWINKQKIVSGGFEWADEYFAVSISESQVNKVKQYIRNQEEHHRKKTWEEEVGEFLEKYGFEKIAG